MKEEEQDMEVALELSKSSPSFPLDPLGFFTLLDEVVIQANWQSPPPFQRSRQVLLKCDTHELVLMLWGPSSRSSVHGHGGSDCGMRVLAGSIEERRYLPFTTEPISSKLLSRDEQSLICDREGFHSLHASEFCVSLHLYARPLRSMQVYHDEQDLWFTQPALDL